MTTVQPVSFGYNHPIKTAFDKGLLPKGLKGLYGVTLTKKNRSIEHLKPHCKGGRLSQDNVALADKYMNFKRGIEPIENWVTKEMWIAYLKQFIDVKNKFIDGMAYIKAICKRFKIDIKEILK